MHTGFTFLLAICLCVSIRAADAKLKALIVDGQNNHIVWPKSTMMLKHYLEESGLFDVDVARTRFTWNGQKREGAWLPLAGTGPTEDLSEPRSDPDFKPDFAKYALVVSNLGNRATDWPVDTQRAFEAYVRSGGGFVAVHAASNSFGQWEEYNRMIGLGGWGGRRETSGGHVYYNHAGELIRDTTTPGGAGAHGPRHEFLITVRDAHHPITRGLPARWLTSEDECYARLRGPALNLTVLATGKDASDSAPTDRHEPALMAVQYGKGRVFHTTLGHDTPALEGVGFIVTFLRGAEWAATGKVTQPVPVDFPTEGKTSSRAFAMPATLPSARAR